MLSLMRKRRYLSIGIFSEFFKYAQLVHMTWDKVSMSICIFTWTVDADEYYLGEVYLILH